jgi:hypothetical protein
LDYCGPAAPAAAIVYTPSAIWSAWSSYNLLFQASAATLLEVAADPKHLGAEIGFLSILHTWGQNLLPNPHVNVTIAAAPLRP